MTRKGELPLQLRFLAALMRRWPRSPRKLDWWWERTYRAIGGGGFEVDAEVDLAWPAGLQAPVAGRLHPFRTRLNLQDWLERRAFFSGQLYQREIEEAVVSVLEPGDCFVDIGANIGLVSLLAASRVGKAGHLIAVEANPSVFARLNEHFTMNGLLPCSTLLNLALGDKPSTTFMHVPGAHTGVGTLTLENGSIPVSVQAADAVVRIPQGSRPICIKMDVEGYEGRVLAGMTALLSLPNTALIVEISRDMLRRVGDSPQAIHELLRSAGFSCYSIHHQVERWCSSFHLESIEGPLDEAQYDVLFIKRGSIFEQRVMRLLRPSRVQI